MHVTCRPHARRDEFPPAIPRRVAPQQRPPSPHRQTRRYRVIPSPRNLRIGLGLPRLSEVRIEQRLSLQQHTSQSKQSVRDTSQGATMRVTALT